MPICWLSVTNKLIEGVKLLNLLPTSTFTTLLSRVTTAETTPILKQDDLKLLQEAFNLSEKDVQLLIQSLEYVWKQLSRIILKPTVLQKDLTEDLKFDPEKAEEIVKAWSEKTKTDCGDLEKRLKLESMSWELSLQSASSLNPRETIPKVRLQLSLAELADREMTKNVSLDLNEEQLLKLYNTLENIQVKLDNIQKAGQQ